jgi:hypothetical protein
MNRFINTLLLFLFFPTMGLAIIIGFDLPIEFLGTTGAQMAYKAEVFVALGLLFLLIVIRRSIRRWMGMKLVLQTTKFSWNKPVSRDRLKRIWVYNLLELFVNTCVGIALVKLTTYAWLPAIALFFVGLDNLVFSFIGTSIKGFRVGVTSKAVISADREVTLMYYDGLRRVSIHQGSLFFDYIKGLQLHFPMDCIDESDRGEFFTTLENQLDPKRVFVTRKRD